MAQAINFIKYYATIAGLAPGQTQRVNHTDCPAGEDTRERLYLTRDAHSKNRILGYCHNCQEGGTFHFNGKFPGAFRQSGTVKLEDIPLSMPKSVTKDPKEWGAEAQRWRIDNKLLPRQLLAFGIGWDYSNNSIVLPIWKTIKAPPGIAAHGAELLGYQARNLEQTAPCKYSTYIFNKEEVLGTYINTGGSIRKTILVEDFVSAMQIVRATEKQTWARPNVIVNYGVQVKPELYVAKTTHGLNIVWLDNDNDHVRAQAEKIARVWKAVSNKNTVVITDVGDPKHKSMEEIHTLIGR